MPDVPNPYTHRNRWHAQRDRQAGGRSNKLEIMAKGRGGNRRPDNVKPEKREAKLHHKLLIGLQGRLVNEATDKTIALNEWPVMFTDASGSPTNLIPRFTVHLWTFYCSKMKGYPGPTSKAAQKILLYLSVNPVLVSKTWRNRLYYYSSGSILGSLNVDFRSWFVLEGSQDKAFHDIRKVR